MKTARASSHTRGLLILSICTEISNTQHAQSTCVFALCSTQLHTQRRQQQEDKMEMRWSRQRGGSQRPDETRHGMNAHAHKRDPGKNITRMHKCTHKTRDLMTHTAQVRTAQ